ncbi:MAG: glycosyltransferase family 2 protein [Planctomycetes bacterium]|nr:glycosyltransferase family 2 protein [Planctomycetota bacterium]
MPEKVTAGGISVVIPAYDEEESVPPLAAEILAALSPLGFPFEVVFVDDGSRDGTAQEVARAAERDARIRLVRMPENSGQSAATWAGVRAARMKYVATMDGDGQNDPADVPLLLSALSGADLAIGRRLKRHDSWVRKASSRIANAVRRSALRDGAADTGCSLKVFPREAFLSLPPFVGMHRFLPALFARQGLIYAQVGVNHRPRKAGRSKYGVWNRAWRGLVDLLGVMWLLRRAVRVRLSEGEEK